MLEEPLRGLAESIRDGLIVVEEGRLRWSNAAFGAMVGRVGACLEGLPLSEVLQGLTEPLGSEAAEVSEAEVLHTDGRPRAARCRRAWCSSGSGTSAWFIEDLDVPRALEGELLLRAQELASRNREIAALRDQLETERGWWKESRDTLGHEIRTPLTVVGGYTRLLLSEEPGPLNPQQRRFLDESQRSCRRLGNFLDTLLDPSHKGQGEVALEMSCGELGPLIEDVAAMFHPLLQERRLKLELKIGPIPAVRFDVLRVEQVLTNLLGNAVKHAPSGSCIRIGVRALEPVASGQSFVEVAVEDEGAGIAASERERVFEPYVQLNDGAPVEGLGLGLSICRRLVEAHGGCIRLDTAGDRGARFAFTLPVSAVKNLPFVQED